MFGIIFAFILGVILTLAIARPDLRNKFIDLIVKAIDSATKKPEPPPKKTRTKKIVKPAKIVENKTTEK